ncbi:MAG: DUF3794 domain-containing protein [Ruminococcus sp.]|nr:DUF3794 domain-containing protein [Ruminococcus sp.]
MDFLVNHEKITSAKVLLDTTCEQSAELDLVLPDYYPDIFRILKCSFSPAVISQSINGGRFSFELAVKIKILYCSAENKKVNCIEQKQSFTKTLDLSADAKNPEVYLCPRTDYINCRVQNQRRLDIRGCVSTKVKIVGEEPCELLIGAAGANIQLLREQFSVLTKRLNYSKRITVSEEIELSEQKPDIDSFVKAVADIELGEQNIISGKMVVKGNAKAYILYNTSDDACDTLKFSLPFSNILDIDGIDESFKTLVDIDSPVIELIAKNNSQREYTCEISFNVSVRALKFKDEFLVLDAYSTCYECESETAQVNLELCPVEKSIRLETTGTLKSDDAKIAEVVDADAKCHNVQYRTSGGRTLVFGSIDISLIARDSDSSPIYLENTLSFERELDEESSDICGIDISSRIISTDYAIKSSECVDITAVADIRAVVHKSLSNNTIKNIKIGGEKKLQNKNCALKIYRCEEDESVWEIAKRFNTTPSSIISESELNEKDKLPLGMILIPITE